MTDRDLYGGLIRLHILHHAAEGPIFGLGIIAELGRHGYSLSPGTLYPILHGLETKGFLKASRKAAGGRVRRVYLRYPRPSRWPAFESGASQPAPLDVRNVKDAADLNGVDNIWLVPYI